MGLSISWQELTFASHWHGASTELSGWIKQTSISTITAIH